MALTVYGTGRSCALRVLWALEELGLSYEHKPISFMTCASDPAYLAINPAGMIPCVVDGDFVLSESLAITLYLADQYPGLYPHSAHVKALALQWTLFAATSFEPRVLQYFIHTMRLPENERNPSLVKSALEALQRPLNRLELALQKQEWLLGSQFSVADLNVAGILFVLHEELKVSHPKAHAWLDRCFARPAFLAARAKD